MSLLLPLSAFAGVPLTLLNLLVVLLAAAGWCVVARMLARRSVVAGDVAYFGLSLLVLGGLGRSLWTLFNSLWGMNITWLGNILFPLLGPGFICLAWAVRLGWRTPPPDANALARAWLVPILLILMVFGLAATGENHYAGRGWFLVMLGCTTLANFAAILQLIIQAGRWRVSSAIVCYALHLLMVFALAGMSGQTATLQIFKQSLNALSQIAFLAAALMLQRRALTSDVNLSPAHVLRLSHTV